MSMTPSIRQTTAHIAAVMIVVASAAPITAQQSAAPLVQSADPTSSSPLGALVEGLAGRMNESARALQVDDERMRATTALDDSRRLARVLHEAAPWLGSDDPLPAVEAARHALQNGDPPTAAQILREASKALQDPRPAARGPIQPLVENDTGIQVINGKGQKIGKLAAVREHNGEAQAVLKVGGVVDLFGFLDLANTLVTVPAREFVAGKRTAALARYATAEQLQSPFRHGNL